MLLSSDGCHGTRPDSEQEPAPNNERLEPKARPRIPPGHGNCCLRHDVPLHGDQLCSPAAEPGRGGRITRGRRRGGPRAELRRRREACRSSYSRGHFGMAASIAPMRRGCNTVLAVPSPNCSNEVLHFSLLAPNLSRLALALHVVGIQSAWVFHLDENFPAAFVFNKKVRHIPPLVLLPVNPGDGYAVPLHPLDDVRIALQPAKTCFINTFSFPSNAFRVCDCLRFSLDKPWHSLV